MNSLSFASDEQIEEAIADSFGFCNVMSELDASSLYVLLQDMKDDADNKQTAWFNAEGI